MSLDMTQLLRTIKRIIISSSISISSSNSTDTEANYGMIFFSSSNFGKKCDNSKFKLLDVHIFLSRGIDINLITLLALLFKHVLIKTQPNMNEQEK